MRIITCGICAKASTPGCAAPRRSRSSWAITGRSRGTICQRITGATGTMQDERWLRGFALLDKYGLSWELRVPFWHLEEAAAVARAFPKTPIVLNHTGFPWDRSEEGLAAWRRAMAVLAREPNVS